MWFYARYTLLTEEEGEEGEEGEGEEEEGVGRGQGGGGGEEGGRTKPNTLSKHSTLELEHEQE
jgi:hypothetical protein